MGRQDLKRPLIAASLAESRSPMTDDRFTGDVLEGIYTEDQIFLEITGTKQVGMVMPVGMGTYFVALVLNLSHNLRMLSGFPAQDKKCCLEFEIVEHPEDAGCVFLYP